MKIVSLAPSNTEILFELGVGNSVVATTSLCDYPEKAREKQSIGGWNQGLKVDKVEDIDPDIAFASDDLQDQVVEELEQRGVSVVQVKPHKLEELYESIREIGSKAGREKRAKEIIKRMKQEFNQIEIPEKRIYCEEWMDPPMASGNWIPGIIEEIGGNYFISEGERSREFELEELKEFNPEYIFLNVCGAGENITKEKVLEREDWQEIEAVKQGNVYVIDDALLNRPGPRLVEGAKKIKEKIDHVS